MAVVPVENTRKTVFGDDGPCFFKIIFGRAMEELRIPPHFMKHLLDEKMDDGATLEGPHDDIWTIVLHKNENGTYLQEGWPDFIRYHSLGNNEFLLFQYHGNLCFRVRIFDPSGLERVGALVSSKNQETEGRVRMNQIDSHNNNQSETCIPGNDSTTGNPKEEREGGRPRKNEVTDTRILHRSESCKHDDFEAGSSRKYKQGRPRKKKDDDLLHQSKSCKNGQDLSFPCHKLERAGKFEKIKHTQRKINVEEMETTNVEADILLKVNGREKFNWESKEKLCKIRKEQHSQKARDKKRKIKEEKTNATIMDADSQLKVQEREKGISERKKKEGKTDKNHHSRMVKHTKRKIKEEEMETNRGTDSQLEVNDEKKEISKLKKIKCKERMKQQLQTIRPPTEEERARVMEKANSFISTSPCYKCCLKPYNVQKMFLLSISRPFSQAHFPPFKTHIVLRNSKGRGWVVTVVPVVGRHSFSGGWRSFVLDNRLEEGDICIFELVKRSEMQVHVFQVRQS